MGYYHERTIVIGKLMVHHAKFGVPYFQTTQYHQLIVSYISWSSAKYCDCFGPRSTLEISLLGKSFWCSSTPNASYHENSQASGFEESMRFKKLTNAQRSGIPGPKWMAVCFFFCCAMPIDIWQICIRMVIKYHSTTMYQLILYVYIIIYNASFIVSIFRAIMSDSYALGDTWAPAQSQQSFAWFNPLLGLPSCGNYKKLRVIPSEATSVVKCPALELLWKFISKASCPWNILKLPGKEETSIGIDQMLSFQKLAMVRLLPLCGDGSAGSPTIGFPMNLAMSTPKVWIRSRIDASHCGGRPPSTEPTCMWASRSLQDTEPGGANIEDPG